MNYKKYVVSFILCALILFSFVTSWFVPLKSSADVDWEYYGINEGMPYNYFDFASYERYDSWGIESKLFKTVKNDGDKYAIFTVATLDSGTLKSISIYTIGYKTCVSNYSNSKLVLSFGTDSYGASATFDTVNHKVTSLMSYSSGVSINCFPNDGNYIYYISDYFINPEVKLDVDLFGLTKDLLSNLWNDGTIFGDNYDMTGFLPYDLWSGKYEDVLNNVGNDFLDYFKALLGINDDISSNDIEQILYDIDTNNYDTNNYLMNIDTDKRTQLNNTWNNYKKFINNSVAYDIVNNIYKPNTSYLNMVYNNSNYFQNYILGDSLNTFDIVSALNIISGQLNGIILTALTDINTNVTALGGIFANAINSAFADFSLDLKNLVGKINVNLKNINDNVTIGNSISNDINNNISPNIDSDSTLIGKLNLTLESLIDSINATLGDINLNIKNITNNSTIGDSNHNDDVEDNEFWKEVKARLVTKIPLYFDCVEVLKPITGISSSDLLTGDLYLTDNSSQVALQSISIAEPTTYSCFGLLNIVTDSKSKKIVFLLPDTDFFGYTFSDFDLDISYYYYNYRQKLSDVILTVVYLSFAFTVCHRVAVVYGGSRTDNDRNGGDT